MYLEQYLAVVSVLQNILSMETLSQGDSEVVVMAPCYLTFLNILILNINGKGNPCLFFLQKQPNTPMPSLLCLLLLASHRNSSFWTTNYHILAFHTFPQVLSLLSSMESFTYPPTCPSFCPSIRLPIPYVSASVCSARSRPGLPQGGRMKGCAGCPAGDWDDPMF